MKNISVRTILYSILIGSVVSAALVGVSAVLIGGFNDILGRALWTIILAVFHSLAALAYISSQQGKKAPSLLQWSSNAFFGSILVSFLISVFGTWDIVSGSFVWNTYQAVIIALFSVFHTEILLRLKNRSPIIETLIYVNIFFIVAVAGMLVALIYGDGHDFGEIFGRLLGAAAILDGTLTMLVIILEKMFAPKHTAINPQTGAPHKTPNSNSNLILIFLAVTLGALQLFGGFFWVLFI